MAEKNTPKKLPTEIVDTLIEKATAQNNKLTFDDITSFATTVKDFTQKDFAVVMSIIKSKNIELVEKLSPADKIVKKEPAPVKQVKIEEKKVVAAPKPAVKTEAKPNKAEIKTGTDADNPSDEELKSIDSEITDNLSDEEIIADIYEDTQEDDTSDSGNEEEYADDYDPLSYFNDDPVHMYLKEMGKYPILTAVEETILARRIERGKRASALLKNEPFEIEHTEDCTGLSFEELSEKYMLGFKQLKEVIGRQSVAKVLSRIKRKHSAGEDFSAEEYNQLISELTKTEHEHLLKLMAQDKCQIPGADSAVRDLDFEDDLDNVIVLNNFMKLMKSKAPDKLHAQLVTTMEKDFHKLLRHIKTQGSMAKECLANSNLRLVVSTARKFIGRGMHILDLIQEGNMGLLKAVERFDYTKGFKFSTYSIWWIRQAISRALADSSRVIRIPVHMVDTINKFNNTFRNMVQELGRMPTDMELAETMKISLEKLNEIRDYARDTISMDTTIGDDDDSTIGDFIADKNPVTPESEAALGDLRRQIEKVLSTLKPREQEVLVLRYGLRGGEPKTLEEIGDIYHLTRERIRQIETKALNKLRRQPNRVMLQDFNIDH